MVKRLRDFISQMSLSGRIICGLLSVILLLGGLQIWNIQSAAQRRIAEVRDYALQGKNVLIDEVNRLSDFNLSIAKVLANLPDVRECIVTGDRQRLYKVIKPVVDDINDGATVKVKVHFHIPPGVSFLRMWKPNKNGDDISSFRKTVTDVLSTGKPIEGIEAGRVGLAIRGVAPIFGRDHRVIGSVEVATSLAAVAEVLQKARGEMNQIFAIPRVEETAAASKVKKLGRFTVLSEADSKVPMGLVTPEFLEEAASKGTAELDLDNMFVTAVVIPDYQGKPTGIYVRFNDMSAVDAVVHHDMLKAGVTTGSVMIFAIILTMLGIKYNVKKPIDSIIDVMEQITEGKLETTVQPDGAQEIRRMGIMANNVVFSTGNLIRVLNAQAEGLKCNTQELSTAVEIITEGSSDIDKAAEHVASSSSQAADTLNVVARSVNELTEATNEIAQSVAETAAATNEAQDKAVAASSAIQRLGEDSEKIGGIVEVITNIAEQTNLLALNATIEAARAGEAGKGFAVVANEVKELAKQTASATDEISSMISHLQAGTTNAVTAVEEITAIVGRVNDLANTIASAAEEQTATVAEINDSVGNTAEQVTMLEQQAESLAEQASEFSAISGVVEKVHRSVHDNAEQAFEVAHFYTVSEDAIKAAMAYTSSSVQMMGGVLAHIAWYEKVKAAISMNIKPDVEHDANKCLLGKWLKKRMVDEGENTPLMMEINTVHNELHRALYSIDKAVDSGAAREELERIFAAELQPRFEKLLSLMARARESAYHVTRRAA